MVSYDDPHELELVQGNTRYQTLASLSSGAYGSVQLAMDQETSNLMAVKFIERGEQMSSKYVQREIMNHSRLIHPHIVQFKDVFLTDTHLAIVMEYVRGGDMFSYLDTHGCLPEPEARSFYQQLITGVDYCHKLGVVHRDLKLENIMLDIDSPSSKPIIKICDFGYSKHTPQSQPKSQVGTPGYTAPEILTSKGKTPLGGKPADVWSSGVILYATLFCILPFDREDDDDANRAHKVVKRILTADFQNFEVNPTTGDPVSPELQDLFRCIFVVDPAKRITVEEIAKHPWFATDLPGSVEAMTAQCLKLSNYFTALSEDYVANIVQAAATVTHLYPVEDDAADEMLDEEYVQYFSRLNFRGGSQEDNSGDVLSEQHEHNIKAQQPQGGSPRVVVASPLAPR